MFFTELYSSETRKLIERLINYVIYKVILFSVYAAYEMCQCATLFGLFVDGASH